MPINVTAHGNTDIQCLKSHFEKATLVTSLKYITERCNSQA